MGSLVGQNLFGNIYNNRKVLITGHTGFKGSWLSYWLNELGAKISGYSLAPSTHPNHYELLNLNINSNINDIRNIESLSKVIKNSNPEIVFHLAAQPLVRDSYLDPILTYETNVIGTANVLEACKNINSVKAIIIITTDKCYENKEWYWPYRENDSLGGYDPYSASKACAEIITSSYRNSFFNTNNYNKKHNTLVATARAGNVIGGGDWAKDRLIPDVVKATSIGEKVLIRNPQSVRPWQHVLESLSGYLLLGWHLLSSKKEFAEAWNFGPTKDAFLTVGEILQKAKKSWDKIDYLKNQKKENLHEANLLKIDSSKAIEKLKWLNVWNSEKAIEKTIIWYKNYYQFNKIDSMKDLTEFINSAKKQDIFWTKNTKL